MTVSPVSLQIPAVVDAGLRGHDSVTVTLPVKDTGSSPLLIKVSVVEQTPAALAHPLHDGGLTITPAQFRIQPGVTRLVHVHITGIPDGLGVAYVAFHVSAIMPGARGSHVTFGTLLETKLSVSTTGSLTGMAPKPPAHHPAPAGTDWPVAGGIIAASLIAATLAALWARRLRRRPAKVRRWQPQPAPELDPIPAPVGDGAARLGFTRHETRYDFGPGGNATASVRAVSGPRAPGRHERGH
jgi:hypothetical protein